MLNINHNNVERFYDYLDEGATLIYEKTKKNYLDGLLYTLDYLLGKDDSLDKLDSDVLTDLEALYENIAETNFNKEEIRKALQLALLKALKHLKLNMSDLTPDTMGMLFSYLVNLFFENKTISVLEPTVGYGNLLFTLMNHSDVMFNQVYGVDVNSSYLQVAIRFADVLEYEVEFFNQNNLQNLYVPQVDLLVSDLPVEMNDLKTEENLITVKKNIQYKPYIMIEHLMRYVKPGGYFIYLIPNDFFIQPQNEIMKDIILNTSYIEAIIELPLDMFKEERHQKSILVLRKRGEDIEMKKEILMLRFPSFIEIDKVRNAMAKIKMWYENK